MCFPAEHGQTFKASLTILVSTINTGLRVYMFVYTAPLIRHRIVFFFFPSNEDAQTQSNKQIFKQGLCLHRQKSMPSGKTVVFYFLKKEISNPARQSITAWRYFKGWRAFSELSLPQGWYLSFIIKPIKKKTTRHAIQIF